MKAALLKAYGGVDQFEIGDLPIPQPAAGEVLIKIAASAVNPFDLILRQGFMAQYIPLPLPAVLGGDAAGTVVELGQGVTGLAVGDRVVADFAANGKGAHAEYGVVPATSIAKLPAELSFEEGASLVKAGLTGRQTVEALGVKPGDRIATLAWNDYRHLELYYAVSCMGAVLHTLNPRLFPEQLEFIINHAEDKFLFVDPTLLPVLAPLQGKVPTVEQVIAQMSGQNVSATEPARILAVFVADDGATLTTYHE